MSRRSQTRPTHRIYAVLRRHTRGACWMDVGSAITHADGKGFDLELQTMPLTAEELVIRTAAEHILPNGIVQRSCARSMPHSSLPDERHATHVF
jgi:hypothetical protein